MQLAPKLGSRSFIRGLHSEKTADEGRSKPKGKGILAGLVSTRGGSAAAARGRDMEPLEA